MKGESFVALLGTELTGSVAVHDAPTDITGHRERVVQGRRSCGSLRLSANGLPGGPVGEGVLDATHVEPSLTSLCTVGHFQFAEGVGEPQLAGPVGLELVAGGAAFVTGGARVVVHRRPGFGRSFSSSSRRRSISRS